MTNKAYPEPPEHIASKLESLISGYKINKDDANWLRGVRTTPERIYFDLGFDPVDGWGDQFTAAPAPSPVAEPETLPTRDNASCGAQALRNNAPAPCAGSEISDAQIDDLAWEHKMYREARGPDEDDVHRFARAVLAMVTVTTQAQKSPLEERVIVGYVVHDKKANMQDPANWVGRRIVSKLEASEYTSECVSPVFRIRITKEKKS